METKVPYYVNATEEERKIFRDWLVNLLETSSTVKISFKKKDDTIREMNCTLDPERVKKYEKKTDRTKTVNVEVCPVFDLDKQEWRSFRFETITEIRFEL
jgi:hypothetical protein